MASYIARKGPLVFCKYALMMPAIVLQNRKKRNLTAASFDDYVNM